MISCFIHQNTSELVALIEEQDRSVLRIRARQKWFKRLIIILAFILSYVDYRIWKTYGIKCGILFLMISIASLCLTYFYIWPKSLLRERIREFLRKR